jgi:membrane-bound lytic murein transglycosylase
MKNELSDGTPLPKLEFEDRQRAEALQLEGHEELAWYASHLEKTMLRISAFLVGYGDAGRIAFAMATRCDVAARQLRKAVAKGAV